MNFFRPLLFVALLFITQLAYGDIIQTGYHNVNKCVKITNTEDYPNISLIAYITGPTGTIPNYVVAQDVCLGKGYKFNSLQLFCATKEYLASADVASNEWSVDENALKSTIDPEPYGGQLIDSNPISGIEEFYEIIGFTDSTVMLHKWKEISQFNNGKPDSIKLYDMPKLAPTSFENLISKVNTLKVYPNPASESFHLDLKNSYSGFVAVKMVSQDGKVVKSLLFCKDDESVDFIIQIADLAKGNYYVTVKMGAAVTTERIVIE